LKAEPKAAAEGYARLKAEVTAAEVRLQTLRRNLSEATPEVQQAQTMLGALRAQLGKTEATTDLTGGPDYISKFREFKYQETLFEQFSRQYELARVDEAREGALIQVVDVAAAPEKKSKPKRALTALAATFAAAFAWIGWLLGRRRWQRMTAEPRGAQQVAQLKQALRGQ